MKPLITIVSLFISGTLFGQDGKPEFYVEIVCHSQKVTKEKGAVIIVKIVNNSDSISLVLPQSITWGAYGGPGMSPHIAFDILKCELDSCIRLDKVLDMDVFSGRRDSVILGNHNSRMFEFPLIRGFFSEKGLYKIRAVFQLSEFISGRNEIISDWKNLNVE